jgi:hypothetical protein
MLNYYYFIESVTMKFILKLKIESSSVYLNRYMV